VHLTVVVAAAAISAGVSHHVDADQAVQITEEQKVDVRHIVFLAQEQAQAGGGGGGGGNHQLAPIRRAQGVGTDPITLRVAKTPFLAPVSTPPLPAAVNVIPLPSLALDAKALASGVLDQIGLPSGGVSSSPSTGPGSGGGVGTGRGTGIGPGQGPGLGPGSGGGTGGGVYRPGGAVSTPRLIHQVTPNYTGEALRRRIQGTVVLEAVVMDDGCASQIRIVKSLDRGGLDAEAVKAVAQWRFEPGRLAGTPVNVLVVIVLDFNIR
jgi:TonB family protein